ncbi:MAG: hypothetical protein M3Q46_08075 [Verrucomicrobiota bacterium]|nr:hypothetical protein [Verrucomicrobiota bacterium]
MKKFRFVFILVLVLDCVVVRADQINLAEADASQEAYKGGFGSGRNGGSGFGEWKMTNEGHAEKRHAGAYLATVENNNAITGIAYHKKAWGLYANGTGFEQAVAFRAFTAPLAVGDSFSFLMKTGPFKKKFETDDPAPGSVGLTLRTSNATNAPADYNKDAVFEFSASEGKPDYQIADGSAEEKTDSGVPLNDSGVTVTVTITGADSYDVEIQTMNDKQLTKLLGRKLKAAGPITSLAIFNRDSEKNDAYFNSLQVARENE